MFLLKKIFVGVIMCALAVTAMSCSRSTAKNITLAGSTAFQPFAEKLAEQYMQNNKDIQINVQGGGSAVGIQSAISKAADIGMADLLELPPEAKMLIVTVVASDGIAVVVNPNNPASNITLEQAKDIFSGKITNWQELGGGDDVIRVISREEGSGTRRSFDKLVLGGEKIAPSALYQNSNGTVREVIANDPEAIGYISIGLVNDKVKALSLNNIAPINDNVKKGTYPLSRPVFFLTNGEPTGHVMAFISFVLSPDAQKLLEKEGLITAK